MFIPTITVSLILLIPSSVIGASPALYDPEHEFKPQIPRELSGTSQTD